MKGAHEIIYLLRSCLDSIENAINESDEHIDTARLDILVNIAKDLIKILDKRVCDGLNQFKTEC